MQQPSPPPSATEFVIANDLSGLRHVVDKLSTPVVQQKWVQRKDGAGVRALHVAAELGRLDFVEYFVDSGLDALVNKADDDARTPLHWAAWKGQVEVTKALLEMGASRDRPTRTGFTPLHYAASMGNFDCVEVLVESGALVDSMDESQQRPADVAERFHFTAVRDYLLNDAPTISREARKTQQAPPESSVSFVTDLEREAMELEESVEVGNLERVVKLAVHDDMSPHRMNMPYQRPTSSVLSKGYTKGKLWLGKLYGRDHFPVFLVCAMFIGLGCGMWIGRKR